MTERGFYVTDENGKRWFESQVTRWLQRSWALFAFALIAWGINHWMPFNTFALQVAGGSLALSALILVWIGPKWLWIRREKSYRLHDATVAAAQQPDAPTGQQPHGHGYDEGTI